MEWLRNRLRTMSPAEILSRVVDVGKHVCLRLSLERVQGRARRPSRTCKPSFFLASLNGHLDKILPQQKNSVLEAADRWLQHRANYFALRDAPLGNPINWHCDYSSGVTCPMKYSALINYRRTDVTGDAKYVWELNRLQHLVMFALAGVWTGNEEYTKEINRRTLSWQAQNPFMMGLNWKSPLEAGMRLISWAYVLFLYSGLRERQEVYPSSMGEVVYQHLYFVRNFYSKYSSANNHLIGEMAGLYVGSVFWPHYRESSEWRALARRKLIEEIARQVESDGVGKERATEYQVFIIELFLMVGALAQLIGDPFPRDYWDRLTSMVRYLSTVSNRAGCLPMFGDGDSGQAVWLPETTADRAHDIIGICRFYKGQTSGLDVRSTLLLWGQAPQEIPVARVSQSCKNLEVFPDGGYYVLANDRGNENELVVVFDAGPLGLAPLNAHGHADALSFWLSYGGLEFLIDPGTYCYHSSALWRAYFRGTAAHNTIRVDQTDQSVPGGTFLWREAAHCRVEQTNDSGAFAEVAGSHDGYCRLKDPVVHKRNLRLFKKFRSLAITDFVECQGPHEVELFLHFSEKCQLWRTGPVSFEASNGNRRIVIHLDSRFVPQLYHGSIDPIFGWVSPVFGVKKPAFTLVARASVASSTQFLTDISPI
jgi:Heparinase II/III-like protein/Heparinase II/III N-terminus